MPADARTAGAANGFQRAGENGGVGEIRIGQLRQCVAGRPRFRFATAALAAPGVFAQPQRAQRAAGGFAGHLVVQRRRGAGHAHTVVPIIEAAAGPAATADLRGTGGGRRAVGIDGTGDRRRRGRPAGAGIDRVAAATTDRGRLGERCALVALVDCTGGRVAAGPAVGPGGAARPRMPAVGALSLGDVARGRGRRERVGIRVAARTTLAARLAPASHGPDAARAAHGVPRNLGVGRVAGAPVRIDSGTTDHPACRPHPAPRRWSPSSRSGGRISLPLLLLPESDRRHHSASL